MDQPPGRDVALEAAQKAQEFPVLVALHALADHRAVENIEGGEQGGGAMADIIVGRRPGAPSLRRQSRLRAVERLDMALLVNREHQAVRRRVDVKTDATTGSGTGALPGLRVLSRSKPSTPSSIKRRCQRHTHGLETPARRDLWRAATFGGGQHDPCSPHMLLGTIATDNDRLKPLPIARSEPDFDVTA